MHLKKKVMSKVDGVDCRVKEEEKSIAFSARTIFFRSATNIDEHCCCFSLLFSLFCSFFDINFLADFN